MALVVLLRGVNVGGHRAFRPTKLVGALGHLDPVNIGAAGTFVVHRPIAVARLRDEMASLLPFNTEIMICRGQDIVALAARDFFAGLPLGPDLVPFVTVLARPPRTVPRLPLDFPAEGDWILRVLARTGRFVVGVYRRQMRAIGYLGKLDRAFGVAGTTRNWRTIAAIAKVVAQGPRR